MRTRTHTGFASTRFFALALVLAAGGGLWGAPAVSEPLWTLTAESDIVFQRLTPLGSLLVSTDNALMAIDPATGQAIWKLPDVHKLKECNYDEISDTPLGLLDIGEGVGGTKRQVEVIDLETGQVKWDSKDLPMNSSQGLFQVPQKNMLLMVGAPKKGSKSVLVAVDIETGAMKWQQDKTFQKPLQLFEVKGSGKMFKRFSVEGNQPPAFLGEDAAMLWLSQEGPVKIDLNTGNTLWACAALKGKLPPALQHGYARFVVGDGAVFVPFEKRLQAIDPGTGALLWAKEREFKSRIAQMWLAPEGLVVRGAPTLNAKGKMDGKPFIDLLDPKTGASKWAKPFKDLEDATTFDIREGKLYIAADNELFEIDIASGAPRSVAKFKFKGGEVPHTLEVVEGGYCLISSQNMMMIAADGSTKYHAFHSAPGSSMFSKLASTALIAAVNVGSAAQAHSRAMTTGETQHYQLITRNPVLSKRFKASQTSSEYASVLTKVEADGRSGPGLVKVSKATGEDVAKVVLGDKTPEYEMDSIEGRVFFLKSDKEIVCYKF